MSSRMENEVYPRLADQKVISGESRNHFCATAGTLMKRMLADHVRHRRSKRAVVSDDLPIEDAST